MNILECGIDDEAFGAKEHVGGYHIQQDPEEFQGLIDALRPYKPESYLSVGIASGGSDRYLCESLIISHLTVIDNGEHPRHHVWNDHNKPNLTCRLQEFIGDSHSDEAEQFLSVLNRKYDLIGIDGDHTPCGVRLDWMLVEPYLKPGTIVWFHDVLVGQGTMEFWIKVKKKFQVIYESNGKFGIGAIRV